MTAPEDRAGASRPQPPPSPPQRLLPRRALPAAALAFAVALLAAWVVADVTHPPALFPKYLEAAAAPPAAAAERLLDYSPLYLAAARLAGHLAADSDRLLLGGQAVLHAATAAAVTLSVALLAGSGWGLAAGLGAALYRPFLVDCGIEEPEILIAFLLAAAILAGLAARARLTAARPRDRAATLLAAAAFAAVVLAGLARPQHLALLPGWAAWIAASAPRGGRRALWLTAAAAGLLLAGPLLVSRSLATGAPTLMNPGAVFYEGNGPGATGLTRFAPAAVIELERAHPEAADYGHVAYRQIASWASGRRLGPAAANRYWTRLAFDGLAAAPGRGLARLLRKAALALGPYEAHDLAPAEMLDRRLRPLLPTGFALLLLALPWIAFARRPRLAGLAGPLAVALLALAVQVVTYASARQRLPLALALWIAGPVVAADLFRGRSSDGGESRLRGNLRPPAGLLLGLCAALWLAQGSARSALLDQLGWDRTLGPEPPSAGARLLAWEEGRALRPALARDARRFAAGVALARAGRAAESLAALAPLAAAGGDFTIDDKDVGVPAYWAAVDLAALGDLGRAGRAAAAAAAVRPDDPRVAALALYLDRGEPTAPDRALPPALAAWRPPGVDPASARLDLSRAAAAAGARGRALALLAPLDAAFPELAGAAGR